MHEYAPHSLALAVLVIGIMQKIRFLDLQGGVDIDEVIITLQQFIDSDEDLALNSELLFMIEGFLLNFCPDICTDLGICHSTRTRQVMAVLKGGGSISALQRAVSNVSLD